MGGGSSVGRASRSQCEGREFDPPPLHSLRRSKFGGAKAQGASSASPPSTPIGFGVFRETFSHPFASLLPLQPPSVKVPGEKTRILKFI